MYEKYVALRDKNGYTDYGVAKETNIPASTFSEWKNGKYEPKLEKLRKIAALFGVNVSYFVG